MLISLLLALGASQPVPFDAARWDLLDPAARVMPYLGQPSLFLDNGLALARDVSFGDGTIDVDVAFHGHASFAGVAFRAADEDDYELIYLRPQRSRQPDALQYTPIFHGSEAWQLYSGDGYTAAAELPLNGGYTSGSSSTATRPACSWTTRPSRSSSSRRCSVRGPAAGSACKDGSAAPTSAASWRRPRGPRRRRRRRSAGVTAPAHELGSHPRVRYGVSSAGLAARCRHDGGMDVDGCPRRGLGRSQHRPRPCQREDGGQPAGRCDLVFARSVVTAERLQRVKLTFGYSDAVRIFLNGRLVFAGESAYRSRDPGFLGIASLGPDAIFLDLTPGENEIVLAVAEAFGGWGFLARLARVSQ